MEFLLLFLRRHFAGKPPGEGGGRGGDYAYCLIQGVFGKTPSYLTVKVSFTVAREKDKNIYLICTFLIRFIYSVCII